MAGIREDIRMLQDQQTSTDDDLRQTAENNRFRRPGNIDPQFYPLGDEDYGTNIGFEPYEDTDARHDNRDLNDDALHHSYLNVFYGSDRDQVVEPSTQGYGRNLENRRSKYQLTQIFEKLKENIPEEWRVEELT